ncbi:MAG: MobF family relaxase [Burkholderiaceae bacterium]|nr:MobF family relaxase [Burkholderiaceae bacterium]
MLSISKGMSAAGAVGYHMHMEKDSLGRAGEYYTKEGESGYWMGNGSNVLGLSGQVAGADFKALCEGYNPNTGEALMRNAGDPDRRAGYDLTFSAPKSVSVAWAIADPETRKALEAAHGHAVQVGFSVMQDKAGYARTGAQGQQLEKAELVAAAFQHGTSREQDAQLHTHVFVMNSALRVDGSAASLASEQIFEFKMSGGAAYQCSLAHELQRLGYTLERDGDETFRIKSVPKGLEAEQSTRRAQIEAYMLANGAVGAKAAAVATLATRNAKGDIDLPVLRERWTTESAAHGYTPEMARPENPPHPASNQKNEPTKEHPNEQTNLKATNRFRADTQQRAADGAHLRSERSWSNDDQRGESVRYGGQRVGAFGLPERYFGAPASLTRCPTLEGCKSLNSVRTLSGGGLDDQQRRVEGVLSRHAPNHLVNQRAEQPHELRRTATEQLARPTANGVLAKATEHDAIVRDAQITMQAYRLSICAQGPEQAAGLAMQARHQAVAVARIDGMPDAKGQAYTTKALLVAERDVIRIAGARTGEAKAALHLNRVTTAIARTGQIKGYALNAEQRVAVERLCCEKGGVRVLVGDAGTGKSTTLYAVRESFESVGFVVIGTSTSSKAAAELRNSAAIDSCSLAKLNSDIGIGKVVLDSRTVIVIDEAGMTDSRAMSKIMLSAEEAGATVILVGDHKQLQPVGAGNTFKYIAESIGSTRLEDNQRQRAEWEREAVKDMSKGHAGDALARYVENDRVHVNSTFDKCLDDIAARQIANIDKYGADKTIAIASTNLVVDRINEVVREQLKESGKLHDGVAVEVLDKTKFELRTIELATDDRVLIGTIDKEGGYMNGDIGTVLSIDAKAGSMEVKLDRTGEMTQIQLGKTAVDHAYAITTHKAQGSTYEVATVYLDKITSQEMSYVQTSRAREATDFVTSSHTLKEVGSKLEATPEQRETIEKIAQAKEDAGKGKGAYEEAKETFAAAAKYIEKNEKYSPETARAVTEKAQLVQLAKAMSQEKQKESTLEYRETYGRGGTDSGKVKDDQSQRSERELRSVREVMQNRNMSTEQTEKAFREALSKVGQARERQGWDAAKDQMRQGKSNEHGMER